jgi:GAF domain-containing protein
MAEVSRITSTALVRIVQAVHAVEAGEYFPDLLDDLIKDSGEIGQMARVFDSMARGVQFRDRQLRLMRKVIPIGVSLSAEKDFHRLLETVVAEAQTITNADAGTLYLLEDDKALRFMILRNTSLKMAMGGTSGNEIQFYPVRLYNEDGSENLSNVASYVALKHERVNIADAYEAEGFDFSGTKGFDNRSGYRSKSFLTVPLEGIDKKVIGVLQLINAKDPETGEIVRFESDDVLETLVLMASAALDGYIREEKLRQEIAKLKIEIDESRRAHQVAEITDSEFFRDLKSKAKEFRAKKDSE